MRGEGGRSPPTAGAKNKNAVQDMEPTQRKKSDSHAHTAQHKETTIRRRFLSPLRKAAKCRIMSDAVRPYGRCVGALPPAQAYGCCRTRKLPHFCFSKGIIARNVGKCKRWTGDPSENAVHHCMVKPADVAVGNKRKSHVCSGGTDVAFCYFLKGFSFSRSHCCWKRSLRQRIFSWPSSGP